jgi:hypothetical protein
LLALNSVRRVTIANPSKDREFHACGIMALR